jgi:endonuclease/exonuclease/phosphatase family metal-dependent hydrolase
LPPKRNAGDHRISRGYRLSCPHRHLRRHSCAWLGNGLEPSAIRLLTLNAHQGFTPFRRRKLLSRIRDALRASGADLVFLQEVGGEHGEEIPQQQYELLADQVWPQHAYGRNVVATGGHLGNALLSKFPIVRWQNVDVSVDGVEPRGMLHCVLDVQPA